MPSCPGVWANEKTLEECRDVLKEVLEEWIVLKLRNGDQLPSIGGINLNIVV
ncbi:type II toxin-antitoxin system HicB family antitoxin [Candidatus Sordicultor fermentans]|uniref:type II toxin-antitoxin system HicB family antitoxin n=1 Tax=Candidatus Sordicultor fermentans TaxID=1953203 RepID=UPI0039089315